MRDLTDLESRGLPAVGVASTEFIEAVYREAEALGYDPAVVFVPHPIQDRTDEDLAALAREAVDSVLAGISR